MTWYEWSCKSVGYVMRESKQWAMHRHTAWCILKMHAKDFKLSPSEFLPLLTDPPKELAKPIAAEDLTRLKEIAASRILVMQKFGKKLTA